MIVEILFNEVCNLFGDGQNVTYLQATLPDAEFIFTPLTQQPFFAEQTPDMIYIGAMSESMQRRVIEKLMPLRSRIQELIDQGVVILATGNAGEIFCKEISYVTEDLAVDGLNIFDISVKTDLFNRYNGKMLCRYEDIQIVGFRSQFSFLYGDNSDCFFVSCERGIGINKNSKLEGLRKNNLICTQIIGPILPLNPLFCEKLVALTGSNAAAAYRDAAMAAYEQRLIEFKDPNTAF